MKGGSIASDSVQNLVSADGYEILNDKFTNETYDMDGGGKGGCGCNKKIGGKPKPKRKSKKVSMKGGMNMHAIETTFQESIQPIKNVATNIINDGKEFINDGKAMISDGKAFLNMSGGSKKHGGTANMQVIDTAIQNSLSTDQPLYDNGQEGGKKKRKNSKYPPGTKNKGKYLPKKKHGGDMPHISELSDEDDYGIKNANTGGAVPTEVIQLNYNQIPLSDSTNGAFQSREVSSHTLDTLANDISAGYPFSKNAIFGSVADNTALGQLTPFSYATGGGKKSANITFTLDLFPIEQAKALKSLLKLSGANKVKISKNTVIGEFSKSKNLANAVKNLITPLQKLFANTTLRSNF